MRLMNLFSRQRSAKTAQHRLQVLLMHERGGPGNADLIPINAFWRACNYLTIGPGANFPDNFTVHGYMLPLVDYALRPDFAFPDKLVPARVDVFEGHWSATTAIIDVNGGTRIDRIGGKFRAERDP